MICADFRRLTGDDDVFLTETTRAERSACVAHFNACADCRAWMMAVNAKRPPLTEEQLMCSDVLAITDFADPEARS